MQVYLVGGAVRDALLGIDNQDQDYVVVGADAHQMLDLGFLPVGADFPVFLHPQTKAEFALARTERKQGTGYLGFEVDSRPTVTLAEDLLRRDLTINAMAIQLRGLDDLTPIDGTIIDPYGGQQDLQARCLRHVSDAFSEDPLRVLRVARFYGRYKSLGFEVDDSTLALMRGMVNSGELSHLTCERVWQETSRAMMQGHPAAYWQLLHKVNALDVVFANVLPTSADFSNDGLLDTVLRLAADRQLNLSQRWAVFCAVVVSEPKLGLQDLLFRQSLSWHTVIIDFAKTMSIPKKVTAFAQLTADNAGIIHDLLTQSLTKNEVHDKDNQAQAKVVTKFIHASKANKDAQTWRELVDVVALISQAQLMTQMQRAIIAFTQVGVNDIEPNLSGQAIGNALDKERQRQIAKVL